VLAFLQDSPAGAHVAYSPDSTNRYLKATLLPGEVRVSLTVLVGGMPATLDRRRMDKNLDGQIDAAEAQAFGARMLAELAPALAVTVDGHAATGWTVSDVGLGTMTVGGGPFSIDLTLTQPYPDPTAAAHQLVLEDRTVVPAPGESEVRVEESPGVRVSESHLADATGGIELRFPFLGNPAAPGEREIVARFTVDAELRPQSGHRSVWLVAAILGAVALAGGTLLLRGRPSGRYTGS